MTTHRAEITAHLDAQPESVWPALTDADALTAWYWPPSTQPKATSDTRVGGAFGLSTADAAMGFSGEYLELDEPVRIVQSWRWAGDDKDSRVTITLTPAGGGTDLVIVHDRLDEKTAEMYRQGWESCLARLPEFLAAQEIADQ
jgi:uncharacterized protein YndB with AHSA1/START domain